MIQSIGGCKPKQPRFQRDHRWMPMVGTKTAVADSCGPTNMNIEPGWLACANPGPSDCDVDNATTIAAVPRRLALTNKWATRRTLPPPPLVPETSPGRPRGRAALGGDGPRSGRRGTDIGRSRDDISRKRKNFDPRSPSRTKPARRPPCRASSEAALKAPPSGRRRDARRAHSYWRRSPRAIRRRSRRCCSHTRPSLCTGQSAMAAAPAAATG